MFNPNDRVTTHEDMLALIQNSALGAKVLIEKVRGDGKEDTESMRRYTILLESSDPRHSYSAVSIYSLPCLPEPICNHVKKLAADLKRKRESSALCIDSK